MAKVDLNLLTKAVNEITNKTGVRFTYIQPPNGIDCYLVDLKGHLRLMIMAPQNKYYYVSALYLKNYNNMQEYKTTVKADFVKNVSAFIKSDGKTRLPK